MVVLGTFLFWTLVVLVVLTLPFTVGPLVVLLVYREPVAPGFRRIGVEETVGLPAGTERFLHWARGTLEGMGFRPLALVTRQGHGSRAVVWLLSNDATLDVAAITAVVPAQPGGATPPMTAIELVAEFQDGRSLTTSTSDDATPIPWRPGKQVEKLPGLEPARLQRAHAALVARIAAQGAVKVQPAGCQLGLRGSPTVGGDEVLARFEDHWNADHAFMVQKGLLRRKGEDYRLTMKGAVLFTWAQLPPWKGIRQNRIRKRALHFAAELGG